MRSGIPTICTLFFRQESERGGGKRDQMVQAKPENGRSEQYAREGMTRPTRQPFDHPLVGITYQGETAWEQSHNFLSSGLCSLQGIDTLHFGLLGNNHLCILTYRPQQGSGEKCQQFCSLWLNPPKAPASLRKRLPFPSKQSGGGRAACQGEILSKTLEGMTVPFSHLSCPLLQAGHVSSKGNSFVALLLVCHLQAECKLLMASTC